jgi:hypothetical protein
MTFELAKWSRIARNGRKVQRVEYAEIAYLALEFCESLAMEYWAICEIVDFDKKDFVIFNVLEADLFNSLSSSIVVALFVTIVCCLLQNLAAICHDPV